MLRTKHAGKGEDYENIPEIPPVVLLHSVSLPCDRPASHVCRQILSVHGCFACPIRKVVWFVNEMLKECSLRWFWFLYFVVALTRLSEDEFGAAGRRMGMSCGGCWKCLEYCKKHHCFQWCFFATQVYKPGSVLTAIYLAPCLRMGSSRLLGTVGPTMRSSTALLRDRVYSVKPMLPWAGWALTPPFHHHRHGAGSISLLHLS